MLILNCPFRRKDSFSIVRPILEIKIINPYNKKYIRTYGVIDTGADECAIPAWVANRLGHNLTTNIFIKTSSKLTPK